MRTGASILQANPDARPEAHAGEYASLPLRAHSLLAQVPLHDVWRIPLEGGGEGRTIDDVRGLLSFERIVASNPAVRFLFWLRGTLGTLFGADPPEDAPPDPESFARHLSAADLVASRVVPGTPEGPFRALYASEHEAIAEIRNATVHAFSVYAIEPRPGGYWLYWGIYVRPVGRVTGFYMALIDPFRKWIVYPAIIRSLENAWQEAYA